MLLALLLPLGCGDNSSEHTGSSGPGALSVDQIVGSWQIDKVKATAESEYVEWPHEASFITFNSDGSYEGSGYFGSGSGVYFVDGNTITTMVDGLPYIVYTVTSLQGDVAEIEALICQSKSNLWLLCSRAELLDIEPEEGSTPEITYPEVGSGAEVEAVLMACYRMLSDVIRAKMQIEESILRGEFDHLTTLSAEIESLWGAVYQLLSTTNNLLDALAHSTMNEPERLELVSHACALRGCAAYLLGILWGDAPYYEESLQAGSLPQLFRQEELFDAASEGLSQAIDTPFRPIEATLNSATALMMRAEIALTRNRLTEALALLQRVDLGPFATDAIFYCYGEEPQSIALVCYTKSHYDLLMREAEGDTEALVEAWGELLYGRWQMLNRIGLAEKLTGCASHHRLLPIPESELHSNTSLTQNPGY